MISLLTGISITSCKTDKDKAKETAEAYLYKNMKNPESLKILSCEVRLDTVPFWLSEDILKLAKDAQKAVDKFSYYSNMSSLFASEKFETAQQAKSSAQTIETAYNVAKDNDPVDIEYIVYIKSSGTNPIGGIVSNSSIIIIDKNDPSKILGTYLIDSDFIKLFTTIKMFGGKYEFKTNKFGKYQTNDMSYFEQFIMNETE